jgi:hypothetical protein
VLALAASAASVSWFGRHWIFRRDEWGFILYRRSGGLAAYFAPFNGHLVAGMLAIYNLLFATFGMRNYGAYRGVEIALCALCAGLLYVYARRRGVHPVLALLALVLLAFLGPAWEVLFWLASAGFIIPVAAMLGIFIVWDAKVRYANAITALLAAVALGTHSVGVAVVAGLIVASLGEGRHWRRLLALGAPLAAWAVWFTAVRVHVSTPAALRQVPGAANRGDLGSLGSLTANFSEFPAWLVHSASGAFAAVAGGSKVGLVVALALAVGALWALQRGKLDYWRFLGVGVTLFIFWVFTWLARAQKVSPTASRYLYPGVALLLILAVECTRDLRLRPIVLGAVAVLVALSTWSHVDVLNQQSHSTAAVFSHERVLLSELESCQGRLPPTFIDIQSLPAGPFWAATAALGDPVPPALRGADPLCPSPPAGSDR